MPRSEWVGRIDFDAATSYKIRTKHNLTEAQVREAVMFGYGRGRYKEHTPYGTRLEVIGVSADGTRIKAWLEPIDRTDGHWQCKTAVSLD